MSAQGNALGNKRKHETSPNGAALRDCGKTLKRKILVIKWGFSFRLHRRIERAPLRAAALLSPDFVDPQSWGTPQSFVTPCQTTKWLAVFHSRVFPQPPNRRACRRLPTAESSWSARVIREIRAAPSALRLFFHRVPRALPWA